MCAWSTCRELGIWLCVSPSCSGLSWQHSEVGTVVREETEAQTGKVIPQLENRSAGI